MHSLSHTYSRPVVYPPIHHRISILHLPDNCSLAVAVVKFYIIRHKV